MERLIYYNGVKNIDEYKITRRFDCIKVTMTDDKIYYLQGSINAFQELDKKKESTLVRTIDAFGCSICINPSYIKTIREGQCVIVETPSGYMHYYLIGSNDTPKLVSEYPQDGDSHLANSIYQDYDVA